MKVLHVIDALGVGGGAEHSLVESIPHLQRRGVENFVVCLTHRVGGLQAQLEREGIDLVVLRSRSILRAAWELRRIVDRVDPDLVHSTLFRSNVVTRLASIGTDWLQINSRVSTSYDPEKISAMGVAKWKLEVVRWFDRMTALLNRGVFHVISGPVARETEDVLRVPMSRIHCIPRGRSRSRLGMRDSERREQARAALGLAANDFMILNVGRQDTPKAQDVLVKAFSVSAQRTQNLSLFIAGREGSGSRLLERALLESTSRENIHLLGHRTDVPELLCAADAFVFPSHIEGLGGVLIEAMALGCPIVASDAPAIVELLSEREAGLIVPRGNVAALADAIVRLAVDQGLRQRLQERALQLFHDRYQLEVVIDRTVEMYEELVRSRDDTSRSAGSSL